MFTEEHIAKGIESPIGTGMLQSRKELAVMIDFALGEQREECAKIAENYYRRSSFNSRTRSLGQDAADGIAAAIRKRVQ